MVKKRVVKRNQKNTQVIADLQALHACIDKDHDQLNTLYKMVAQITPEVGQVSHV